MDFSEASRRSSQATRRVPEERLPPLLIAWDPDGSDPSGVVHQDVRENAGSPNDPKPYAHSHGAASQNWSTKACRPSQKEHDVAGIPGTRSNENFDTRAVDLECSCRATTR